jgi:uncharacterized cupin superfamily protein
MCARFSVEGRHMSNQLVTADPSSVELQPAPFPEEWIIEGRPQARAREIARSQDGAMTVIAWSCSKGRFRWRYQVDEMLHILSGEVILTDEDGSERRVGPGDTVFCPAGHWFNWHVVEDVRKVAVCHVAVPRPVTFGLRAWNRISRTASALLGLDAEPAGASGGLVGGQSLPLARTAGTASVPPG